MIEVSNLRKGFGELEVLRGITEKIDDGEVVCILTTVTIYLPILIFI